MSRSRMRQASLGLLLCLAAACAHRSGSGSLTAPAKRVVAEAAAMGPIHYEEDYVEGRLVLGALPHDTKERFALRKSLVTYLLGPLANLEAAALLDRREDVGTGDDLDRIMASFRDALELYRPEELWGEDGPEIPADERALLDKTARLVAALFATRGSEGEVATALLVLHTLDGKNAEWPRRLDELLQWVATGAQLSVTGNGPREAATTTDVLETVAGVWPAQPVVRRLANSYLERQERIAAILRRSTAATPPSRSDIGELLGEDTVQNTAMSVAGLYLRAGQIEGASRALRAVSGKPGDDPEVRQLVDTSARDTATKGDYLALARRFLPKIGLLGGTSGDRIDLAASLEVLRQGALRWPEDAETRILASRVAFIVQETYLSLRYLEEAQPLLEKTGAGREEQAAIASEILERAFAKLRRRMFDIERLDVAQKEAAQLRQRLAETQKRFGADDLEARTSDIDLELARGMLNAGEVDDAKVLLERAFEEENPRADVVLELAEMETKRGQARLAVQMLERELTSRQAEAGDEETVLDVQTRSKLAYALGNAYEVAGSPQSAQQAWQTALEGWERLMAVHLQRKNMLDAPEATMEVARLHYLLGRREQGVAKLLDAIDQNETRDESYIDALAFLVQRGDVDAALDIFRRAVSKPSRAVSEYVKVYAALWIADLTRRAGRGPEPLADGFLKSLATRTLHLRPQRVVSWYVRLARYAVGMENYDQLVPHADTAGKRAELYFYEAMRRLAEGKSDDAHALWNKVIETRMLEFLEFDMAARYLRQGAPTHAGSKEVGAEAI